MNNALILTITTMLCVVNSLAQVNVYGDAINTSSGNKTCVQLTPDLDFKMGAFWHSTPIDLTQSFELVTEMDFGCNVDSETGGDGIAFLLQTLGPNTAPTVIGGGLGYEGISPSVAVQFDTYRNNPIDFPTIQDPGDPAFGIPYYDHVGFFQNGSVEHNTVNDFITTPFTPFFADVEDCVNVENQQITFVWDAPTTSFQVSYCSNLGNYIVFDYTIDLVNTVFGGETQVYWGFTASTGGASNTQEVCVTYLDRLPMLADTTVCINENLILDYSDLTNLVFEWKDSNGSVLSNSPIFDITALTNETYEVVITNTCTGNSFVEFFDVNVLAPTLTENLAFHEDIDCFGYQTGQLAVEFNNSVGQVSYSIDASPAQNLPIFDNLFAGVYNIVATDELGCSDNINIEILQEDELIVTVDNLVGVECNTVNTGSIEVTLSGGNSPYIFSWEDDNSNFYPNEDLFNINDGFYTYTLIDDLGCLKSETIELEQLNNIDYNLNFLQDVSCFEGSDGAISVDAIGGLMPYSYSWQGPNSFVGVTNSISNVTEGTYNLLITDDENCYRNFSFDINSAPEVIINEQSFNTLCSYSTDGQILLNHSGGTGVTTSYLVDVNFNLIDNSDNTLGLGAGDYYVYALDGIACSSDTLLVQISSPAELQMSETTSDVLCFGQNQGAININLSGGTPPYASYNWSGPNGFTFDQQNLEQLFAGEYSLVAIDNNGCVLNSSIDIYQPAEIIITANTIDYVTCTGSNTGAIDISISGGTPPYDNVSWSGENGFFALTEDIQNLYVGSYTFFMQDDYGCNAQQVIDIYEPEYLLQFSVDTTSSCLDIASGTATLNISGGVPPYSVDWQGADPEALSQGVYSVTVTDDADCIVTNDFNIDLYPQPQALFEIDSILMLNESYKIVNTSLGANTFNWDFNNIIFNSDEENPIISYPEEGYFNISLSATSQYGCTDTVTQTIFANRGIRLYIPNTFTPNGDSKNDRLNVKVLYYSNFQMEVYSRSGELMFKTQDPSESWDGTYNNNLVPMGTYIAVIYANDLFGRVVNQQQTINLIR